MSSRRVVLFFQLVTSKCCFSFLRFDIRAPPGTYFFFKCISRCFLSIEKPMCCEFTLASVRLILVLSQVYLLASVRLRELLAKLEPDNGALQSPLNSNEECAELKKIWSVFENCLVLNTEILLNRHLDQILLCTCYLMGKVSMNFDIFVSIFAIRPM